jgi:8-oxo-dGTP pyrophosphatase MutT (NUDIX family)
MKDEAKIVYEQAAAIPFRIAKGKAKILLITSNRRKHWIVPKGVIEDWQSAKEAAQEEAYEEAGVQGKIIGGKIGNYEYAKWGGTCRVDVFLLRVDDELKEWPESEFRERRWADISQALEMIDNQDLSRLIQSAAKTLEKKYKCDR